MLYLCNRCDAKTFRDNRDLQRHIDICKLEQQDIFNKYPTLWKKKRNIIVELADFFDVEQDFKYDYMIVFDLEALLHKINELKGRKLKFLTKHSAVSVSIATNAPGFDVKEEFILSENPKELTKMMFKYFDDVADRAREMMLIKMLPLIRKIDKHYNEGEIKQYFHLIEEYCSSIPIVGFNTGFYDTNLLMDEGFLNEILARDREPFVIKDGKRYKVIKTNRFIFLDQMNYCAADTDLRKFIKAYDVGEEKGHFPYEWFDDYSKLDFLVQDLSIDNFDSSLKNSKLSQKEFDSLMQTCKEQNLITVRDL